MARLVELSLPGLDGLNAALRRFADELPPDGLPTFLGVLETAKVIAWSRLLVAQRGGQNDPSAATASNLVDAEAMARELDVPKSWLLDAARQGRVPCVHVGRYVRFDPTDVRRAITECGAGGGKVQSGLRSARKRTIRHV